MMEIIDGFKNSKINILGKKLLNHRLYGDKNSIFVYLKAELVPSKLYIYANNEHVRFIKRSIRMLK